MKLMYIFSQFYLHGGVERIFTDKMNSLADEYGYDVHCVGCFHPVDVPIAFDLSPKIHVHKLGVRIGFSWLRPWKYINKLFSISSKLERLVDEVSPDVIIFPTCSAGYLRFCHFPLETKVVLESHMTRSMTRSGLGLIARKLRNMALLRAVGRADRIVALTEADARNWPTSKTVVIPNFTNVKQVSPYDTCQNLKVVALGRLHPQKGFDLLAKSWAEVVARHPDWHLEIYGDNDTPDFNVPCAPNMQFLPATSDVAKTLYTASIFVMPSRYEGFGLVLLEAMTCGIPSVAFDCPDGPAEIVGNSGCCHLVPLGDTHLFADRICHLIEHPEERQRMSAAAIERSKAFSRTTIMNRWNTLFQELM